MLICNIKKEYNNCWNLNNRLMWSGVYTIILLPISNNVSDYDVLTPNNFLLGYKSCDVNIGDGMQTGQIDYRQKWKQVQNIANIYWNRWFKEYIPILTPRSKWTQQTRNFKIRDLIIINRNAFHKIIGHWGESLRHLLVATILLPP